MLEDLTSREREIFDLLLEGVSSKEIACRLYISPPTVDFHRTKLYRKLGIHSLHELFAKYSANGKTGGKVPSEPEAEVKIPVPDMGFFSLSDAVTGRSSTSEVFISREEIDGVIINSVLNIKVNLVNTGDDSRIFAIAQTNNPYVIQLLRRANGIRFKARGDGTSWSVEIQTNKSRPETKYACYTYMFRTVCDQVIAVDVPYSSLFLPYWFEQYAFDFNKEKITNLSITANWTHGYGPSLLQVFDFAVF